MLPRGGCGRTATEAPLFTALQGHVRNVMTDVSRCPRVAFSDLTAPFVRAARRPGGMVVVARVGRHCASRCRYPSSPPGFGETQNRGLPVPLVHATVPCRSPHGTVVSYMACEHMAPIIITIITANVHANTKNSSLYARCTTRASQIKGSQNEARAKHVATGCVDGSTPMAWHGWHGMVEVCEGAPVAVGGWVLTDRHDLAPCAANSLHRATMSVNNVIGGTGTCGMHGMAW